MKIMVYNNSNEVMWTQVSESGCAFPDNIPEYNPEYTCHGASENASESHPSTNAYKIPTVVRERINYEKSILLKRPYSADDDTDIDNKRMKLPESKCVCINNENNTQIFSNFEGNYSLYSGNTASHEININHVYGSTSGYDQSLFALHPINTQNLENNMGKSDNIVPTSEKHKINNFRDAIGEIINGDSEIENSGQKGSPFIQVQKDSKNMAEIQLRRQYNKKRRKITNSVTYNLQPVIVVWCPLEQLTPDFIVTSLGKHDEDLEVRDWWSHLSLTSSVGVWGGAIAEFMDKDAALAAAKDLSHQSKHVKILQLSWLFSEFVNAEVCHPLHQTRPTTRIVASGRRCPADDEMTKESVFCMETMFRQCGDVLEIKFHLDEECETVCDVTYAFASQAYLAKFLLTGMYFKPVLNLCIKVEETQIAKDILKSVKGNVRELLEGSMWL